MSRRTLPVRRLAVAALAPLALTTLAACSDGDPGTAVDETSSSTSSDPTQDAPTEEAPTEAAPTEESVAAGESIEPAAFMQTFEGAFAQATTAHMTMTFASAMGDMTAEGDADYSKTPPDMSMTMGGAALQDQEMQMVMVDGVMYMKMPAMGEKWQKIDLNDPSNPFGSMMSGQMDPKAMFESFGDSLGDVTYEGETDIDGDAVKEYSVTVDTAAILESQGLGDLPQSGDTPKQMTYSMFFTDDGLFRRMAIDMGETMGQMTMDLTDWGSDVTIEAPPAGEVTEFDMGAMVPSAPTS